MTDRCAREDTIATLSKSTETTSIERAPERTDTGAMAMVSTLFFAWGFLTCLNDILIPHLKNIFDLNYAEVMLVQFAFFTSYFIFAFPSGKIVEWLGYARAMVAGLLDLYNALRTAPEFDLVWIGDVSR